MVNTTTASTLAPLLQSVMTASIVAGSTTSLWRGVHIPTAPFYIQMVDDPLATSLSMTDTTTAIYKFDKIGDYIRKFTVEIYAPVLHTVTDQIVGIDGVVASADDDHKIRLLVDDLPHQRENIRSLDIEGATLEGRLMRMSNHLVNMASQALPTNTLSASFGITPTSAFYGGRDCFPAEDAMAAYCRFAPCYLLRQVDFTCQQQIVDTVTPESIVAYHSIWCDRNEALSPECAHDSNDPSELRAWSASSERQWTVVLPYFWSVGGAAQAMRFRAIHNHDLQLNFTFAPLSEIITGSPSHVAALSTGSGFRTASTGSTAGYYICRTTSDGKNGAFNGLPISTAGGSLSSTVVAATHFSMRVRFERIMTTPAERAELHRSSGTQLIVTHRLDKQEVAFTNTQLTTAAPIELSLQPKLSTLAWVLGARRYSRVLQNHRMDFSGPPNVLYRSGGNIKSSRPMFSRVALTLNSSDTLFDEDYNHLHRVQPAWYAANNNIPEGLMVKNMGIGSPYAVVKKGSLALSALDAVDLQLTPNVNAFANYAAVGGVGGEQARFFLLSYTVNLFSWKDGMAGKEWS